ncbi:hypothetical protein D3C75_884970 [compost metagenome]
MVRWLIQNQCVCTCLHHFRQHTANFLSPGEYASLLLGLLTREQHTAQEATQIRFILIFGILTQPIYECHIHTVKELGVIFREISLSCRHTPSIFTAVRFRFTHKNIKQQ